MQSFILGCAAVFLRGLFQFFTNIDVKRGSAEVGIPFHVLEQLNKAFASARATVRLSNFGPFQEPVFSRMLRRRVPVLRLGSRGPGGDQICVCACVRKRPQAFASVRLVRKLSQAFASVRGVSGMAGSRKSSQKSSRDAKLSSLFGACASKSQQSQGSGGVVVAKRRTVVTFRLVSGLGVPKVSTVTGIGRVVVAKRRTVVTLDSRLVLASQKRQQSPGSGGS